LTHGTASAVVRLARRLDDLPETAAAFEAGELSRAHAQVMADACTEARAHAMRELEPQLVAAGRTANTREFRSVLGYVCDALDGDGGAATANAQRERQWLTLRETWGGMFAIEGLLDRETAAVASAALDAAMDPPRRGDTRTASRRRAEAFHRVCEAAMPNLASGPGRAGKAHLDVHVDLAVLERRAGPDLAAIVRTEAEHVGRLSAATLRRISCDGDIARVITAGRSEPLDVGRRTRIVSPSLWRALVARDGGCVEPGCDRPPGWCDAHHIVPWAAGGETRLDNLELRCRSHHIAVHEGGPAP
jgi:hypothetical protein